ncbi:holocytochrome c synthase [Mucor velutinosus]|uniref:Holocytochrome c synthase n=1 Tax=Mucor velutinosus TaxID=708070 RepID=A0AAN7DFR1_9FUNG|nr:holocytochrome c synthase [Mucor velutinosus]
MLNILLFAILFAFVGTRNGRVLLMKTLRAPLSETPFSVRRVLTVNSYLAPLFFRRAMIYAATYPLTQAEKSWIHHISEASWNGVWIAPNLKDVKQAQEIAPEQDLVILYIHGGGFTEGYSYMYMDTFQTIIRKLKNKHNMRASILSLEYNLSPEHTWPTASTEALDCYRYLIHDLGISPSKVILAGDSAGGNLVATTLLRLKDRQDDDLPPLPLPAGAVLLCPWLDLTAQAFPAMHDTITPKMLDAFKARYLTNANQMQDPLVSPMYGDFSRIRCPFFVAYGSQEILKPSIETFIANIKRDGCDVTVLRGKENTTHNWLITSLMATSRAVYERDCQAYIDWMATTIQQ